jgi:hypothetical protein
VATSYTAKTNLVRGYTYGESLVVGVQEPPWGIFVPRGYLVLTRVVGCTGDIYYSEGTAVAAKLAAGCTIQACRAVLSGECSTAFSLIRPPGHHATNTEAMGFCFCNNAAAAARAMVNANLARRVLILDWDIHHGNGTQDILVSVRGWRWCTLPA